MKKIIILSLLSATSALATGVPVVDVLAIAQAAKEVSLTITQMEQIKLEVTRLGNPADFQPPGASALISSLAQATMLKTWDQLRNHADGIAAMQYDGDGLYQAVGTVITTADGTQTDRPVDEYKKFDALSLATANLETVIDDTNKRRQQVVDEIKNTTTELLAAQTTAEVAKIQATLSGQNAELAAINQEREAAINHVIAQKAENENDAAKQEQAAKENAAADFHSAEKALGNFLVPNTEPVHIQDPRNSTP